MGRFLSPDWDDDPSAVPFADFSNPQTLNLYSYSRNNPLRYADPDGHDVQLCTTDAYGNQNCNIVSNDQYTAAQQGNNGSLNVPSLDTVGTNGSANITDSNGNTVGSATYVPDSGADYYAPGGPAVYAQLSNTSQVVKAGAAIYAGVYAGAFAAATVGGGLLATGIEGETPSIEFGKTAEQASHAMRHVMDEGLNPSEVQSAIKGDITSNGGLQSGSNTRYIDVDGRTLRYNAYKLPDGTINVGKIVVER